MEEEIRLRFTESILEDNLEDKNILRAVQISERESLENLLSFDEVIGMFDVKQEIVKKYIIPLLIPKANIKTMLILGRIQKFFNRKLKSFSLKAPIFSMALGTPGTGKYMLLQAIQLESNKLIHVFKTSFQYISLSKSIPNFFDIFHQMGEFYKPCILYFDEMGGCSKETFALIEKHINLERERKEYPDILTILGFNNPPIQENQTLQSFDSIIYTRLLTYAEILQGIMENSRRHPIQIGEILNVFAKNSVGLTTGKIKMLLNQLIGRFLRQKSEVKVQNSEFGEADVEHLLAGHQLFIARNLEFQIKFREIIAKWEELKGKKK